jgi:hypothetical protein
MFGIKELRESIPISIAIDELVLIWSASDAQEGSADSVDPPIRTTDTPARSVINSEK